ncbi:MAG: group 1 hemoglobin [Gammaproteobacteria bacterium]|jgi:hemoglobin|nr:group 1 hemoglobin [Gammaproteobacteria bacterium]
MLIVRSFPLLLLMLAMSAHASPTLYERIGGEAKLKATVDEFTNIILEDDRINFTFADSDMSKFKKLIFEQLCEITQGPCKYTGRDMHEAHAKLNLNNAQFNALAEDLYIAFDRVHVPYRVQNKVMALLAPMQRDVVKPGFVAPGTQKPPSNVR